MSMYTKFQLILSDEALYYFIFIQYRDIDTQTPDVKTCATKCLSKLIFISESPLHEKNKKCLPKF